jgi:hypothetical protein
MANSFAQQYRFSCPNCNNSFTLNIWLIIDVNEFPDLYAKANEGKLNDIVCPKCQNLIS